MSKTETKEPHPLAPFGLNGEVKDNAYADKVLDLIEDVQYAEPDTIVHNTAIWFLLESDMAFFLICGEAGIDAEKLRDHLKHTGVRSG